jgi:Fe-S cluster assembly protein SufD
MLIESFIGEALEKVEHEGLREAMAAIATEWLAAKPATKAKAG